MGNKPFALLPSGCAQADCCQRDGCAVEKITNALPSEVTVVDVDSYLVRTHKALPGPEHRSFADGAVYRGSWKGACRHGHGVHVEVDGSIYDGQWVDDKAHGNGSLRHADGDTYDGQWLANAKHGNGVYVHRDGTKYVGQWVDDVQCGQGKESWKDGCSYFGQYRAGCKNGEGIYTWGNACSYEGQFLDNEIHGEGVYVWSDGCTYKGQWSKQQMHGKGTLEYPDGRLYEGEYRADLKDGVGKFTWPDGRCYEGQWSKGEQHGFGEWTQDGKSRRGMWKCSVQVSWEIDEVPALCPAEDDDELEPLSPAAGAEQANVPGEELVTCPAQMASQAEPRLGETVSRDGVEKVRTGGFAKGEEEEELEFLSPAELAEQQKHVTGEDLATSPAKTAEILTEPAPGKRLEEVKKVEDNAVHLPQHCDVPAQAG